MALTDLAIRNLKPAEKPFKASDSGGLHFLVNPNGSRLWRLKYRCEGKEKLLALGAYPIVTLAKAREKRDDAKAQLADGIDPARSRRESRIAAVATSGNTFRLVAEEYLDKLRREGRAPATLAKVEWLLSFAYGDLGERPISEIAAAEVFAVL